MTLFYANNKGADQPVHPHSLISTFVIRFLESIISKLVQAAFLYLASLSSLTDGLSLTWLRTPEDSFSRDKAQMLILRFDYFFLKPNPTTLA